MKRYQSVRARFSSFDDAVAAATEESVTEKQDRFIHAAMADYVVLPDPTPGTVARVSADGKAVMTRRDRKAMSAR